ncbi:MAG: ABC transporter ATP-binding protein, partial [Polaromonas sp. 39-63-203]
TRDLGVLWATHLVGEAERADRIVVLDKGRVLFDGLAEQLCEQQQQSGLEGAFLKLTGARS